MLGIKKELENTATNPGILKTANVERLMMNKSNKNAFKIKDILHTKILWEVLPRIDGNKYVITSTSSNMITGLETYMFAADEEGNIIDWGELEGSYRGSLDHKKCFQNIGYSVHE